MLITKEMRKELDTRARLKGSYQVLQIFPPVRLAIMRVGTIIGVFDTYEACAEAVSDLEEFVIVPVDTKPVGWTVEPQLAPPPPRQCGNGGGLDCLCLVNGLDGIRIFCVVNGCEWSALCKGACEFHYGHVKLFGDLSKAAVSKTQSLIEKESVEPCIHGEIGHHGYEAVLARWEAGVRQKPVSLKQMVGTGSNRNSRSAEETKVLSELLGVNIRPAGEGFTVVDKNGTVLAYGVNRKELLEEFYG